MDFAKLPKVVTGLGFGMMVFGLIIIAIQTNNQISQVEDAIRQAGALGGGNLLSAFGLQKPDFASLFFQILTYSVPESPHVKISGFPATLFWLGLVLIIGRIVAGFLKKPVKTMGA